MSGTFVSGSIASGQVPASVTALYTVPTATVAYLKRVFFFNNSSVQQTVVVSITQSGGSARNIRQFQLNQNESATIDDEAIALSAGDTINAVTTTASEVDFTITGALET